MLVTENSQVILNQMLETIVQLSNFIIYVIHNLSSDVSKLTSAVRKVSAGV